MAHPKIKRKGLDWKELLGNEKELMKAAVQEIVQEVLEAEMDEIVGARKGERTADRTGYRSGYYSRGLITRVGKLELRVPQDRAGRFSTEVFQRYQRSEKALVSCLAEMYVQGVSTRKVRAVTEELCGHSFSASSISRINQTLDDELQKFATRHLDEEYPYLILDARYEKVREDGVIRTRAVMIAIGINWDGRRSVLAVEVASRESATSWHDFIVKLQERGLQGVEFVVSDHHAGLKKAIGELLPEAIWQRCYVHFLRNALDYLPRKADDDCLQELRWLYDRRNLDEARRDLTAWLQKWQQKYPKLCSWVEDNIDETLSFYRLPLQHHKHLKSSNMLERLNEEIKRRTLVVRCL
jgi:putative transposase